MIKRILSVFLTVLLVAGLVMVPTMGVSADEFETVDPTDYVPEAKPASLATISSWDNGILGIDVTKNSPSYPYVTVTAPAALDTTEQPIFQSQNNTPGLGAMFSITSGSLVAGKTYVLSYKVTNANPSVDATVVAGIVDGSGKMSKNNVVTDVITGAEQQTVARTITLADTDTQTTKTYLRIGLGISNTHNWFKNRADLAFVPNSSIVYDYANVYLAQEVAYDIENTLSVSKTITGSSVTGNAKVVNQIGDTGALEQAMTFKAVDSEGKDVTDEYFSIPDSENGAYTVNVNSNAPEGTYTILAISSAYNNDKVTNLMQAPVTLEIESGSKFTTDYAPDPAAKPASLATISSWDNGILGIDVTKNSPSYPYVTVTAPAALDTTEQPIYQSQLNTPGLGAMFSITSGSLVAGKTYVLSYKVTNANPSVDATVVAGIVDGSGKMSKNNVVTDVITGAEQQTVARTITLADTDTQTTNTYLRIGLGISNTHNWFKNRADLAFVPNSSIVYDYANVYLAEEAAYDIDVTAPNPVVRAGGTLAVNAAILNQVGMEGVSLNQNFEWVALDSTKKNIADGITVTWDELDSSVATVSVAADVAEGTYVIAAYNAEYDMAKSITITVSNEVSVENIALDSANNKVTFDALNVPNDNFDVKVYIAEYTEAGKKLVQAEAVPVTLSEGNNIGAVALYENVFNTDNLIKIFVWKSDLTPLAEEVEVKKN